MGGGNNKEQRYENVLQSLSSSAKLICSVECPKIGLELYFGV